MYLERAHPAFLTTLVVLVSFQTFNPFHRSYKAEMIKTEWKELMESSTAALDNSDIFYTLPYGENRGEADAGDNQVIQVLTVQEKIDVMDAPPPAELYVNLLDEDDDVHVSDCDTASMSTGQK